MGLAFEEPVDVGLGGGHLGDRMRGRFDRLPSLASNLQLFLLLSGCCFEGLRDLVGSHPGFCSLRVEKIGERPPRISLQLMPVVH
ncbi:hypothetical protein [Streptomyces sp. RLB1-9]|uniref:hypothetical protein n=1 Tax=unclassified Streptomyces TaxID=2593676 RepID=UPI001C8F5121